MIKAITKKTKNKNFGEDLEKRQPIPCWWECKLCNHYGKQYRGVSKTKNRTPIWSSNSTHGYISKRKKKTTQKAMCTSIFIRALLTTAKIWKHSECPLIDEWIEDMVCVYMSVCNEILLSHKKNEFLSLATTWMHLEDIMLGEIIQGEKDKYCIL